MVTPLRDQDHLDEPGLERLIGHLLAGGVHGLFILGSTGEAPNLSHPLRRELVTRACRIVAGRVPVLVGVTDTSFTEMLELSRHSADAGASALVFTTPYYFPMSQEELLGYVRRIVPQLPLPVMLYNMPRMTKVLFEPATIRQLLDLPQIVGVKDSGADLAYFEQVVEIAKQRTDWAVFVGPERFLAETIRRGGHGGVNGGANLSPRLLVDLYDAAVARDEPRLAELQKKLTTLGQIQNSIQHASALFKGLKCALSLMGICSDVVAEPFTRFEGADRERIRAVLAEVGLLKSL
jgi:4-hydroxy-tetrahydrodipicolinate synthase